MLLEDYGIRAEMTATERVGVHRYTFPKGTQTGHIVLDLDYGIYHYDGKVLMANVRVEDSCTLTGYRITRGEIKVIKIGEYLFITLVKL